MSKICVRFLIGNSDHEIECDPSLTVLQFKELLRQRIPFLKTFSGIPTSVLKLSLEGYDGGELTGNVMEDDRPLSAYPLTEERHPLLLALERPVEKIVCLSCHRPFVQWSSHRLCCGDTSEEKEDTETLEKRKARIPQLLNCGHSVCLECLRGSLTEVEENILRFECPEKSCGVISYRRKDQEWQSHGGMQRLVHLKKREWVEAEKARGYCSFVRNCGAEAIFRCWDCNDTKYCVTHFQRVHQLEDMSGHVPQVLLSSQVQPSLSDIITTQFCCYCGGGTASCMGAQSPHCEHGDACTIAKEMTRAAVEELLESLGNLQLECRQQVLARNGLMEQLREHRVRGVERIRKEFDHLISRLEARKEDMVTELRRRYREKELQALVKIEELGKVMGELEAGLMHYRQSLNDDSTCGVVREIIDMDSLKATVSQRQISNKVRAAESLIEFSLLEAQDFLVEFCQISDNIYSRSTGPKLSKNQKYQELVQRVTVLSRELKESAEKEAAARKDRDKEKQKCQELERQIVALKESNEKDMTPSPDAFTRHSVINSSHKRKGEMRIRGAACLEENWSACQEMMDQVNVDSMGSDGKTALYAAILAEKPEVVRKLIEMGADVNLACNRWSSYASKTSPLCEAVSSGSPEIVRLVLSAGCSLEADKEQYPYNQPFLRSIYEGDTEIMEILVQSGFNINEKHRCPNCIAGDTPLFIASETLNLTAVKWLVEHGADIRHRNEAGETCLVACFREFSDNAEAECEQCIATIEYLVQQGVDVTAVVENDYSSGVTALSTLLECLDGFEDREVWEDRLIPLFLFYGAQPVTPHYKHCSADDSMEHWSKLQYYLGEQAAGRLSQYLPEWCKNTGADSRQMAAGGKRKLEDNEEDWEVVNVTKDRRVYIRGEEV